MGSRKPKIPGWLLATGFLFASCGSLDFTSKSENSGNQLELSSTRILTLDSGYRIQFKDDINVGRYAIAPNPYFVVSDNNTLEIESVTHPEIPSAQISISYTPEAYASNGQPYDPELELSPANRSYNESYRLRPPFTIPSVAAVRHLHFTAIDQARKTTNRYPYLDYRRTEFVAVVRTAPSATALFPPVLGSAALKASVFSTTDVLTNAQSFTPQFPMPNNLLPIAQVLARVCSKVYAFSGYSNLSGGQKYVSNPDALSPPLPDGSFPWTYGGDRSDKIAEILLTLLNPQVPQAERRAGLLCFAQNIGLGMMGAILGGFATNEGGGQGGGIHTGGGLLMGHLFRSNSLVQTELQVALQEGARRTTETTQLYRSTVDGRVYYGISPFHPDDYARCAVGYGQQWGGGTGARNWTYCLAHATELSLRAFDSGVGGGYQEIASGMMLMTAFFLRQVQALRDYVPHPMLLEYLERYLRDGTQCYNPAVAGALQTKFEQVIAVHNSQATGQGWTPISNAVGAQLIGELQARQGYFHMSYHNEPSYRWLLDFWGIVRP